MADVHNKKTRSYNMSKIRGKDTKPELIIRSFIHSKGFRFRIHVNSLPGKPDIVLPKYKTIIMVHGCFWHGHEGCKYFKIPKTRTEWWTEKIKKTSIKDRENENKLKELGWKVITIFECNLKPGNRDKTLKKLLIDLQS